MSIHTVIESLAAFEAVRARDPQGDRVWWTTSPCLLVNLPQRGETVRSPEEDLPQAEFDGLAKAGRDLGQACAEWLNQSCAWKEYVDFRPVFTLQLARSFFVTLYKALLLDRVQQAAAGEPTACVGDPRDPELAGLGLAFGRFDTLFARLAAAWEGGGFAVAEHVLDARELAAAEQGLIRRRLGLAEKVLGLLNTTPGAALFKAWRNLAARRLWPLRGLALNPLARRTFHVHKGCELLEEAVPGILARGGRVALLPALPRPDVSGADPAALPDAGAAEEKLRGLAREMLDRHGVAWRPAFGPALDMAVRRSLAFLDGLRRALPGLTAGFASVLKAVRPGHEVLSNALTSPVEALFYCFCRSRGVKVNAFDHGVTLGLSAWSLWEAGQSGMLAADRGLYHCLRAVDTVRPLAPWQEMHAVGLPRTMARVALRPVQRLLARRLLGIGPAEQVVMHVPDLDRNNFVYGPHQDNDLQFLRKTREVTAALCRAFPGSLVALKLYPTQRYADRYDFADLAAEHPNLRIVPQVDFRFLRAAADLIVTSSTQSTLGWVAGSGAAYLLLDFAWSPARVGGLRLGLEGVAGLDAAIAPDAGQVCSPGPRSAAQVLMARGA